MYERIAKALLTQTFFRISAVVSLDDAGRILGVSLFSTEWPQGSIRFETGAHEIWLISNHEDGCRTPYPQDWHNFCALARTAEGAAVRFFLCSEYFSCFEVKVMEEGCAIIGTS